MFGVLQRDLCIALADQFAGGSIDKEIAELGVRIDILESEHRHRSRRLGDGRADCWDGFVHLGVSGHGYMRRCCALSSCCACHEQKKPHAEEHSQWCMWYVIVVCIHTDHLS